MAESLSAHTFNKEAAPRGAAFGNVFHEGIRKPRPKFSSGTMHCRT
jgi:hypothetical protein